MVLIFANRLQILVEKVAKKAEKRIVIAIEPTQLRKTSVGPIQNDEMINLNMGDILKITSDQNIKGNKEMIYVKNCKEFTQKLLNNMVYFDMGSICASVKTIISNNTLECEIHNQGIIYEHSQVSFSEKACQKTQNTELQESDTDSEPQKISTFGINREDIQFCSENDIDFIIHSIFEGKQEILGLKSILQEINKQNSNEIKIIAKLESEEAIKDIEGIIEVADAILVPRGVLGTILPIEKISWIQKSVIKFCNLAAKPVILASQFLDSMMNNPFPVRAEVADIHLAIMDGADCLLLNQETTVGKYPLEALKIMQDVCITAESHFNYQDHFLEMLTNSEKPMAKVEAVANSFVKMAFNLQSPIIISLTDIGRIIRMISKYRPYSQLLVICKSQIMANQCCLSRSATAIYVNEVPTDINELIDLVLSNLKQQNFVKKNDDIIFVSGVMDNQIQSQFQIKLLQV